MATAVAVWSTTTVTMLAATLPAESVMVAVKMYVPAA